MATKTSTPALPATLVPLTSSASSALGTDVLGTVVPAGVTEHIEMQRLRTLSEAFRVRNLELLTECNQLRLELEEARQLLLTERLSAEQRAALERASGVVRDLPSFPELPTGGQSHRESEPSLPASLAAALLSLPGTRQRGGAGETRSLERRTASFLRDLDALPCLPGGDASSADPKSAAAGAALSGGCIYTP